MNWDQVKGNWKQLKGTVKEKWGQLTDDYLTTMTDPDVPTEDDA